MDFDPQGSSAHWLQIRSPDSPAIKSIDAVRPRSGVTLSWQFYSGNETEVVVIDTPAGVTGGKLVDLYHRADTILIPVMPSVIDLHAVAGFFEELGRLFKRGGKRVAVIANRVGEGTQGYHDIEALTAEIGIPLLAALRDTQDYSIAMSSGLGICELKPGLSVRDRDHWQPILEWLIQELPAQRGREREPVQGNLQFSGAKLAVS
jgi:chromosome partitioning protein